MNVLKPILEDCPKAKPLALTLIKAVTEQEANYKEFELACNIAKQVFKNAIDFSTIPLSEFQSEVKADPLQWGLRGVEDAAPYEGRGRTV